jgi:hypothetical protein
LPLDKIEKLAKKWKMSRHNRIERFLRVSLEDRFAKTFSYFALLQTNCMLFTKLELFYILIIGENNRYKSKLDLHKRDI